MKTLLCRARWTWKSPRPRRCRSPLAPGNADLAATLQQASPRCRWRRELRVGGAQCALAANQRSHEQLLALKML